MSDLLGGQEMAKAIWKKTQKEIDAGSMGPPQTWDEIDELFKGRLPSGPKLWIRARGRWLRAAKVSSDRRPYRGWQQPSGT